MSSGLDCRFWEKALGEWYYDLEIDESYDHEDDDEDWRDSHDPEYDTYGPFDTFAKALDHLDWNHSNPGGYSLSPHPDSKDRSWEEDDERDTA